MHEYKVIISYDGAETAIMVRAIDYEAAGRFARTMFPGANVWVD